MKTHLLRSALLLLAFGSVARAEVTAPAGFVALYNGRDLAGWRGGDTYDHRKWLALPEAERTKLDAEWTADMRKHWRAEGDELVNDGFGKYATTVKDYGDFELLVDYRTVPKGDSGIYLRGVPQVQIWDYTDKAKFPLGSDKGSGGLWNNSAGAPGKDPLVKADKPFGEWNHFRVVMMGSRVSVWLNNQLVVDRAVLENYYDRTTPIPERGPIQLQTHDGEIHWRNVFVREIGAEEAGRLAAAPTVVDRERAAAFVQLALKGIDREYPNKPGETLRDAKDIMSPSAMHPAFFGNFDWHSCVHGHWLVVRLLRVVPDLPNAAVARAAMAKHLTAENLAVEAAYFESKENKSFERMYGWAWALRLAAELKAWDDPDARQWAKNIAPLEKKLVALTKEFLPKLTYPVRTGTHPDTAFALGQIIDYARAVGDAELEKSAAARARQYYLGDKNYPTNYEPSGEDFFSPGLNEADLLRRVLSRDEFSNWLDSFLPGLRGGELGNWAKAAEVSDLSDARIVHLVGLNLSRAWTLRGVISALAPDDPRRVTLERSVSLHEAAGLKHVFSGNYEGEHWLATFAVYHVSNAGLENLKAR